MEKFKRREGRVKLYEKRYINGGVGEGGSFNCIEILVECMKAVGVNENEGESYSFKGNIL